MRYRHLTLVSVLVMGAIISSISGMQGSSDAASSNACYNNLFGGEINCSGSSSSAPEVPASPPKPARPSGVTTSPSPDATDTNGAPLPALGTDANGNECLYYTTDSAATTPAEERTLNQLIHNLGETFGACPAAVVGAPGAVPAPPNPVVYAQGFWNTTHLPVPAPSIPPGWAITGKPAYLVTDGTVAPPTYTYATPLGTLTITATGSYTINWGDGSTSGPFDTEGLPYPNGNISHTYDDVGTVTVTVDEAWTATWALDGAGGTLDQLQTQATVANFQIRQIQAVITG
jgi:hypothetical protein